MSNNYKAKDIKKKKATYFRKFYWYGLFLIVLSIVSYSTFYYFFQHNQEKQVVQDIKKQKKNTATKQAREKIKKSKESKKIIKQEDRNIIAELIGGDEKDNHIAIKTKKALDKTQFEKQKKDLLKLFDAYIDMLQKINSGKAFIKELNFIRSYSHYNPDVGKMLDDIEHIAKSGVSDNAKILLDIKEMTPDIYMEVANVEQKKKNQTIFKRFANSLLYIKSPSSSKSSVEYSVSKLEQQIGADDYKGAEESINKLLSIVEMKKLKKIAERIKEKKELSDTLKKLRKKLF